MALTVSGFSHVAIRVVELPRSRRFYTEILGFPPVFEAEGVVMVTVGAGLLGILGNAPETPVDARFDPFRVGLDHLSLAVESEEQLHDMQRVLDTAGVRNEGVQDDGNAKALVFYDPDGIALELYFVPG